MQIRGCTRCDGNPPANSAGEEEIDAESLEGLVSIVEGLVSSIDAGWAPDLAELEPWQWQGVTAWRLYEKTFERLAMAKLVAALTTVKK